MPSDTYTDISPDVPRVTTEGREQRTIAGMTSVIIPMFNIDWHLVHYTGHCIGSAREHTNKPMEIILVDNGSTVGFSKPEDYKVDKYIKNETNLGVAQAWNQGIRAAEGEYICLLNNDVLVFDEWLDDMIMGLEYADLLMATPMYGEPFSRAIEAGKKRDHWLGLPYQESLSDFTDWSCVVTRKSTFSKLGLFDEQFELGYGEDLDFMRRMKEAGLKYASTKRVNTFHVINGTFYPVRMKNLYDIDKMMNDNKEKLAQKWDLKQKTEGKVWGEDIPGPKDNSSSPLIRCAVTGDKVYLLRENQVLWVKSPEVLTALGYGFGDIREIGQEELYKYSYGEVLTMENVSNYVEKN
jgi:glycosyltransferase involved in cell wall biosynthesis